MIKELKISHNKPKIYDKCREVFGVNWDKGIVITYGDTIYCKFIIPDHLEAHEQTHIGQQKEYGVDKWWDRYLIDKDFRLSQEVEAYRNQVIFLKKYYNRHQRRIILRKIYKDMATIYGGMCTEKEAKEAVAMVNMTERDYVKAIACVVFKNE